VFQHVYHTPAGVPWGAIEELRRRGVATARRQ
jgi:hypothetical protein